MDKDRTQSAQTRVRRTSLTVLALAVALPVLLAGCGAAESDTVTPQAPVSATPTAGTQLTIVTNDGEGKVTTSTLTCDPAGGTLPDPDKACAALTAKGRTALPPVAKGMMCTQIYGGPQTATLTGTWQGTTVNAHFSRTNGCEVSRWEAMDGLLVAIPTGGPGAS